MITRPVFEGYPLAIRGNYPSSRLSPDHIDYDKHLAARASPNCPGRFQMRGTDEHEVLGRLWIGGLPIGD